jgi:hypothetical protein
MGGRITPQDGKMRAARSSLWRSRWTGHPKLFGPIPLRIPFVFEVATNPPLQQTRIKAQTMRTGDAIRLLGVFVTTRPGKYCTIT